MCHCGENVYSNFIAQVEIDVRIVRAVVLNVIVFRE